MCMALCASPVGNLKGNDMSRAELLANLLFSETKDYEEAAAILSVIGNRLKRPQRFGGTLEEVVFAPHQFSGVNSPEWEKAATKNFTPEEESIYKNMLQISNAYLQGAVDDPTGGADHYVNLDIADPSWAKEYKKTGKIGAHTFFSELGDIEE